METKKILLHVHVLLFSAKWREEEEKKLALLFAKYRQSILLPMQAVFT